MPCTPGRSQAGSERRRRGSALSSRLPGGRELSKLIEGSAAIALHFSFSQQDAGRADTFFARLNDGPGLAPHSPILVLRERLIESQQSSATRLSRDDKIVLTIRSWQAFLAGREVPFLRLCSAREREELYASFSWFPPDRQRRESFDPEKEDRR